MDLFGSYALLLAFLCGVYAFGGGIAAIITRRPLLIKSARNAGMAVCVLIWLGFASLAYLFFTDNFSMAYVVEHSNRTLPTFFKFAAIWSGQQGSLLFWSFLLSIYVFSALFVYRGKHPELMPYVGVVCAGMQLFFLTMNNFIASPFQVMGAAGPTGAMQWITRGDGNGLNPLLQYPEMVIHPPILYSGYTGFAIPFAFALGALLGRYPGEKWIHLTRRWTMIAWGFQGVGILLGAHWAYAVLGWGGYWMWDPVENASLMPWLTGTAFLHSVMMQEKRGMMRVWNVWLVFTTFLLTIFGTFLTRSGVVNSVHAFAQSSIGPWFLGFIGVVFVVCLVAFWRNRDYLRSDNTLDSLVSRESSFLFNNLILLVACVAVISGTLFPVLSEWVRGTKISVGAPFFNKVNLPIGLFLLFLTGIGPLLAWRKTSMSSLRRNFGGPLLVGGVAGVVAIALGLREFLCDGVRDSVGVRDADDSAGVLPGRAGDRGTHGSEYLLERRAAYDAQHAAVRRLRRAFRHRPDLPGNFGDRVQSGQADGNAGRRTDADRALQAYQSKFRFAGGRQLPGRAGYGGRGPQRAPGDHAVSRAAFLYRECRVGDDGSDLLDAEGRPLRRVCGEKSGDAATGDSRVSESAGEMDLAGRRDCSAGHAAGAGAEPAGGAVAARGGGAGICGDGRAGAGPDAAVSGAG